MSLSDDLANDFAAFDGLETVTLTPANGSPVEDVPALRHAQRQSPLAPLAGPLTMEPIEATFSLFASALGATMPMCGDSLTDAVGAVRTIVATEQLTLAARWRVVCRRQVS